MAKILTATQVKKLKFEGSGKLKAYSIDSTCALYLVCFANGNRYYKLRTKRGYTTLGSFDDISLAEAREKAMSLRKSGAGNELQKQKLKDVFYAWLDIKIPPEDSEKIRQSRRKMINRVNKHLLQPLGNMAVNEIGTKEVIAATKGVNFASAKKIIPILRDVLKFARAQNAAGDISFIYEIIDDMSEIFPKKKVEHRKAVTDPKRLKEIIEAVRDARIEPTIKNLFFFNLIMVQRPHQIRELSWDRVDGDFVYFREADNKTGVNARLPLPRQAKQILERQKEISAEGIVFKSSTYSKLSGWAISDGTLLKTLKRSGIADLHAHGFRSMFATFAIRATDGERAMFEKRIIDEVLLHALSSEVDKAYFRDFNSREHLRVLRWWADYLEGLAPLF